MKTLLLAFPLFAASLAFGQGSNQPCPQNMALCGSPTTVAHLSAYQSAKGVLVTVTDGSTTTDCTAGGGTNVNTCKWTGSAWVISGTGGGGGTPAGTTGDVQINSGGAFGAVTGEFTYLSHVLNVGNGIAIGTSPPTACGTATGCIALNEVSGAGTPTLGQIYMRADSTTNSLRCSFNGGAEAACNTGGVTLQTNGTNNTSQTALNLQNSAAFNGLTATFTNGSAGNVQAGFSGTLGNAGLTNSSTTVNGQTCTLGSSCTISAGGNHNIDLMAGAAQLTAGCSINNSFLTNTAPTCLFQAGSATIPQQAFPEFTVAGTLGTTVTNGTALYIGPKTMPSDYTASGNLTIHFAVATPIAAVGAATFSVRYAHVTPPGTAQPTFVTTDYSTASLTLSGTNSTVTGTATITAPSLSAGDQVWFVVYLSAKTSTDNPYTAQLYMSY